MPDNDDLALLTQYAGGDESAFTRLVERYINLVYSTALRQVCNPSHAEEITQAVFIILTRKAKLISPKTILSGWLYQTTRLTAANFLRSEIRRQHREQEAYMQSTLAESDPAAWEHITPLLDEAMGRLGETDRNAILLRFFENKTPPEVATALKLNEAAARKRLSRALEKLRKFFTKRGVVLPVAVLTAAISANSVQAAPGGLAATISASAVKGAAVAATVSTLVKGTLKLMTYAKFKMALWIGAGIVLAGGTTTLVLAGGGASGDLTGQIIQFAQDRYASMTSYSDRGESVAVVNGSTLTTEFTVKLARPNLYRIEWSQATEYMTNGGVVWSAGNGDFMVGRFELLNRGGKATQFKDQEAALSSATGISGGAAATIPGTFFKLNWGDQLGAPVSNYRLQPDGKVDDLDCYVLSRELKKGVTRTLWIGKRDFLIHQVRSVTSAKVMADVLAAAIKTHPELAAHQMNLPKTEELTATETHTDIVVNPKLVAADFTR